MKKILLFSVGAILLLFMSGLANADLINIGTVAYNNQVNTQNYNLIWDNDDGLVWLDYTHFRTTWSNQFDWAGSLNGDGVLTYTFDSNYTVDWGTSSWRLPGPVNDATWAQGYTSSSEWGQLYYYELLNEEQGVGGFNNSIFDNLQEVTYWTQTSINSYYRVYFNMAEGLEGQNVYNTFYYGMALRNATVTEVNIGPGPDPVPEPSTMLLLGAGLIGLAGARRKLKK